MAFTKPMPLAYDRHVLTERLWSQITKGPGCWLWTGAKSKGYGMINLNGSTHKVTRLVWWLETGESPGELYVLHRCDMPGCCRPDHLFLGTQADNNADMAAKGRANPANANAASVAVYRAKTHCKHGHEFTPENTKYTALGHRQCRACSLAESRRRRARAKHQSSPD